MSSAGLRDLTFSLWGLFFVGCVGVFGMACVQLGLRMGREAEMGSLSLSVFLPWAGGIRPPLIWPRALFGSRQTTTGGGDDLAGGGGKGS